MTASARSICVEAVRDGWARARNLLVITHTISALFPPFPPVSILFTLFMVQTGTSDRHSFRADQSRSVHRGMLMRSRNEIVSRILFMIICLHHQKRIYAFTVGHRCRWIMDRYGDFFIFFPSMLATCWNGMERISNLVLVLKCFRSWRSISLFFFFFLLFIRTVERIRSGSLGSWNSWRLKSMNYHFVYPRVIMANNTRNH